MHVYSGALERDLINNTMECHLIAGYASLVPEENIPACAENAAKVFLSYVGGRAGNAWPWMEPRPYKGVRRRAKEKRMGKIIQVDFRAQEKSYGTG